MEQAGMAAQLTDAEIIGKILEGETGLYELLIRRYNPILHKTGMAYGYCHEDTQDLMQETFVSAYFNLSSFHQLSSFRTWLIRIMLNNCYRHRKKYSFSKEAASPIHENATPMFTTSPMHNGHDETINHELSHVIEEALLKIPEEYRMVFSMREINGLNTSETASALRISESNVKVRLNRAKTMLRKELGRVYSTEDIFEFNLVYCDAMVDRVMREILVRSN